MGQAQGLGQQAGHAATRQVENIYKGLTPQEMTAVDDLAFQIDRKGTADRSQWRVAKDVDQYLSERPDLNQERVLKALEQRKSLMSTLWNEGKAKGVYSDLENVNGIDDYIQHQYSGDYFKDIKPPDFLRRGASTANPVKKQTMRDPEESLRFLQENPDAELNFSALEADAARAAQQGKLMEKATLGKSLTGKEDFSLADPAHRTAVDDAIKEIAKDNPDYAYKLNNVWRGVPPRSDNWFAKGLNTANKAFKSAATFGIVIPRIGFNIRNRVGGLWQALSNDQARGTIGESSKRALSDLFGAFDDGMVKLTGARKLPSSELTKSLDAIDNAYQQAGGSVDTFRSLLSKEKNGQELLEALDHGVLDNFVSSEKLLSDMAATPRRQRLNDFMQWPASIAQGLEQRMRLGTFLDLRRNKIAKTPQEAARTVKETYLDYSVPGVENRVFRDVMPFGAFLSQNLKQQAGFVARHPVVGVAAAPLFGGQGDEGLPKYTYLDQQMALPVGLDQQGNPEYATSFGLPLEGLTAVPGFGSADLYHDLVSPLQPLLKTAVGYAADKDPFTGQAFGEYDKVLGEPLGAAGRAYNVIKGTGVLQPLTGPLDQVHTALDGRKGYAERALELTTGARFTSVDPDIATRQRLQEYLDSRPDIRTAPQYYQTGDDEGLKQALAELKAAKDRLKAKRALAP
jgi:hypothetical protein